jgi:cytochrome c oxidase cbb3-type subunit III
VAARHGSSSPHGRRPGRSRWVALLAALALALALGAGLLTHARALRARFLMIPADSVPDDPELMKFAMPRGAAAYADRCATCHGARLEGDRENAVPNLADDEWLYGTGRVSEIEHIVLYGIRSGNSKGWDLAHMPAFASEHPYNLYAMAPLRPGDIDDVTTYVLSFQHPQSDPVAVERGSRIFRDPSRGNCVDCHGPDGKGDSAIGAPDLTDGVWLRGDGSRQSIEDTVAHGLSGQCPAWFMRLSPVTIRAVAVYVHGMAAKRHDVAVDGRPKLE